MGNIENIAVKEKSKARMPDSVGITIRMPKELKTVLNKMRAEESIKEDRYVSFNELIIKASKNYVKSVNVG